MTSRDLPARQLTPECSTRLEDQIKETQGKLDKKKAEIIQIQAAAQQAAGASG
jgi:hypothetical protein